MYSSNFEFISINFNITSLGIACAITELNVLAVEIAIGS